jgi:hypothetical protein
MPDRQHQLLGCALRVAAILLGLLGGFQDGVCQSNCAVDCAALDRQPPRDLFDVHGLFQAEGITEEIQRAFVNFLASHDRPMNELLTPSLADKTGGTQASRAWLHRNYLEIPAGRLQLMTEDAVAFDDVRIYSQPLSAEEIHALCKDLKFGQPPAEKVAPRIKRSQEDGGG